MLYISPFRGWQELDTFGIICLTGEACAIGTRILCDVTERGRQNLCSVLGLPSATKFAASWNSKCRHGEHVGSIYLPYSIFQDLAITLCFLRSYTDVLIAPDGCIHAYDSRLFDDAEELKKFHERRNSNDGSGGFGDWRWITAKNVERQGLSCVNQMSGETQESKAQQ